MKLTPEQHAQFDRDGYLFFPGRFTPEETQNLNDAVPELYERREDYNVREKGKDAVRTNFAAHMYSAPFAKLGRHPRMIEPVEELLGEKLYMHQFKINGKMAFEGDVWQWHQDYGTWLNDDMMPTEFGERFAVHVRRKVGAHRVFAFLAHVVVFTPLIEFGYGVVQRLGFFWREQARKEQVAIAIKLRVLFGCEFHGGLLRVGASTVVHQCAG